MSQNSLEKISGSEQQPLRFEVARPEEIEEFKKILAEAHKEEPQALGVAPDEVISWDQARWEGVFSKPDRFFMFAKDGTGVVGLAGARQVTQVTQATWRIYSVYINKKNRGGAGRKLILQVLDEIRKKNCEKVTLNVVISEAQKTALRLYQGLGFKIVKEVKDESIPYYDMELDLKDVAN